MLGAQSKALRIVMQARYGIDPTKIYDQSGQVVGDIANFDAVPEIFSNQAGVGRMPAGSRDDAPASASTQSVPWNAPDHSREDDGGRSPKASSDPFPGMAGGR